MPRRRKYATLTKRDIGNLTNPVALMIFVGIMTGGLVFLIGVVPIILLAGESNFNFIIIAILLLIALSLTVVISVSFFLIAKYNKAIEKRYRGIQIANIDLMTGIEFENYLQKLLVSQGYSVYVTKASGDLGVDLIASKNSDKFAIQAKRYNTKVNRRAISDAVTGRYYYGCNKAMVITNNYFTPDAVDLAQSSSCILIDRDTLAQWVIQFQNTKGNK